MRVLLVGTELAPVDEDSGGLEHVLLGWARELAGRHQVWVATLAGVRPPRPSEAEPFARVPVDAPAGLAEAARSVGAEVVHLQNRPGWAAGVDRAVVTLHNGPAAWADTRCPEGRRPLAAALVDAAAVSAVSRALAGTVATEVQVATQRRPEVAVTYPFADSVFFTAAAGDGEGDRSRFVLFPNRLLRKKGVEVAVAVAAAQPAGVAVPFVFLDLISPWVEPTAEHLALRRAVAAAPNCRLVPPLRRPELAALMAEASVVLVPSLEEEGFGLVSVEAQATGTPAVVSDLGGLPETVPDCSSVCPAGDTKAVARLVERALSDRGDGPERSAWVAQRFSRRASADAVERVLLGAAG